MTRNRQQKTDNKTCLLHSAELSFTFSADCFYCATSVNADNQRRRGVYYYPVTTLETKQTVIFICNEKQDGWAISVKARLLHVHDLPAADVVYHQACSVNFLTGKNIPKKLLMPILRESVKDTVDQNAHTKFKTGRPSDKEKAEAFLQVAKFLEDNDDEQITVNDLINKMEESVTGTDIPRYGHAYEDKAK